MTYDDVLNEIRAANARDRNIPVTGPHCSKCFRAHHCSAYMLPAHKGESALAPYLGEGGLTADNFATGHMVIAAMEKAVEIAKVKQKAYLRECGGSVVSDGKLYTLSSRSGRRYVDLEAADAAGLTEPLERAGALRRSKDAEYIAVKNAGAKSAKTKGAPSEWLAVEEAPKKRAARK